MDCLVLSIIFTVALIEVQGIIVDPGHQLSNSSHLPLQPGQQRYKEIILYLTPSQIRSLQDSQGLINSPQVPNADSNKHTQAHINTNPQVFPNPQTEQLQLHPNERLNPNLVRPQQLQAQQTQDLQSNPFVPIIPPPDYRQPESSAYPTFQSQNPKPQRILKPIPFFSDPNKEPPKNEPKDLAALVPQPSFQDNDNDDNEIIRNQLKQQWLHLLNQNIAHFKALETLSQNQNEKSNENKINFNYLLQNYNKYNDHHYASDVYNLVRSNNEHQLKLEKQEAFLQAEAIANLPPILVHKEINIKHTPAHLIKHVSVPTPVLIPVPDSFRAKVPGQYAVPLELLRAVPLPILKTQRNEDDPAVQIAVQKHIPLPGANKVYIDRPFIVNRFVPQELTPNRASLLIHPHERHH